MENNQLIIGLICVVLIGLIVYYCYRKTPEKKESFTGLAAGSLDNIGTVSDSYDLMHSPDDSQNLPTPHFADLVKQNESVEHFQIQPKTLEESYSPMERLDRVQGSDLLPRLSSHVTPYNVDVANPISHQFMVSAPRVATGLKSRFKCYDESCMLRGDIPITYHPNIPLVSKTQQGVDDTRLDGFFTPYYQSLYNKYTGKEYRNVVQKVSGTGQANGYGGASGGIIMDQ